MAKKKPQSQQLNAAIVNLDGFYDMDEQAQTDMIVHMLELMSPNPDVRERAAKKDQKG